MLNQHFYIGSRTSSRKNFPISHGVLSKKAEKLAQIMGVKNFTATDDWMARWKEQIDV